MTRTPTETMLLEALEEIADAHVPSQPAAMNMPELDWVNMHVATLRRIARRAIATAKGEGQ